MKRPHFWRLILLLLSIVLLVMLSGFLFLQHYMTQQAEKAPKNYEKRMLRTAMHQEDLFRALTDYKNRTGLWPLRLSDLGETVLPANNETDGGTPEVKVFENQESPEEGKFLTFIGYTSYEWRDGRYFELKATPGRHEGVKRGAFYSTDGELSLCGTPLFQPVQLESLAFPNDPRLSTALNEIERRIAEYPGSAIHYMGKIVVLTKAGRYEEALEACTTMETTFGKQVAIWPVLARAVIKNRMDERVIGEAEVFQWLESSDGFASCYALFDSGKFNAGAEGLRQDTKSLGLLWGTSRDAAVAKAYCMALLFYREGKFSNALSVLDGADEFIRYTSMNLKIWQEQLAVVPEYPPKFEPLQAACHHALGEKAEAMEAIGRAIDSDTGYFSDWTEFLRELKSAIETENEAYKLPPCIVLEALDVLRVYE